MNRWAGIDDPPRISGDALRNFAYGVVAIVLFVVILVGMTSR